jgi:hypothetical protein
VADETKTLTAVEPGASVAPVEPAAMSYAAAHRDALTMALDATPAERLAWLEEAIAIAHAAGALPRRR